LTTKRSKGRITGLLALTLEAQSALEVGDAVIVTGDYECDVPDGTSPIIGHVSVANKEPTRGTATRDPQVPGDVTVEAMGWYVRTFIANGAITAGTLVGVSAASPREVVTAGAGVTNVGIALMTVADGDEVDVLCR
jgi:hypothetical protein